jgi:hypothetical protein
MYHDFAYWLSTEFYFLTILETGEFKMKVPVDLVPEEASF